MLKFQEFWEIIDMFVDCNLLKWEYLYYRNVINQFLFLFYLIVVKYLSVYLEDRCFIFRELLWSLYVRKREEIIVEGRRNRVRSQRWSNKDKSGRKLLMIFKEYERVIWVLIGKIFRGQWNYFVFLGERRVVQSFVLYEFLN